MGLPLRMNTQRTGRWAHASPTSPCCGPVGEPGRNDTIVNDDAEVALEAVGEGGQRLLVCLAPVCLDRLFNSAGSGW